MALAAVKTFLSGEVLFAADLNAMNTNILNNALALISPLTGNLNHNNTQALSFRLESLGSTPTPGNTGRLIYQVAQAQPEVDDGTAMRRIPAVQTSTILTGDLITASTDGTWTRLGVGTSANGHLIATSSSSVPTWGGGPASTAGLEYAKAWVVFTGNTTSSQAAILASYNMTTSIDTIRQNSSANWTVQWQIPFTTPHYMVHALCFLSSSDSGSPLTVNIQNASQTSSAITIQLYDDAGTIRDSSKVMISAYGTV